MKLFVLGATGRTGEQIVKLGLEGGHSITALVRNPDKMTLTHENLKVIKGDIFSVESIAEHLEGHDAVLSGLGFNRSPTPVTGYIDSAKCLLEAMKRCNVTRFITMTSWWTDRERSGDASWLLRMLLLPYIRPVLDGMKLMEDFLQSSESIDSINYTVARPPGLTNGAKTDKEIQAVENAQVIKSSPMRISRADVARFMLSCLETTSYDKKIVAIGYQ